MSWSLIVLQSGGTTGGPRSSATSPPASRSGVPPPPPTLPARSAPPIDDVDALAELIEVVGLPPAPGAFADPSVGREHAIAIRLDPPRSHPEAAFDDDKASTTTPEGNSACREGKLARVI